MSGSLIDALKKAGLDPMKNGQIRDAISSILDALDKADINPTNHREMFKVAIPLIFKDEKLKVAFIPLFENILSLSQFLDLKKLQIPQLYLKPMHKFNPLFFS